MVLLSADQIKPRIMNKDTTKLFNELFRIVLEHPSVAGLVRQTEAIYKRLTSFVDIADEFGMDPVIVSMLRPIFKFLYEDWWRVETIGIKNIPANGPAIIVSNHSGMLPYDAVMINMAVYDKHPKSRNIRFLVADFVDNFPFLSHFISRAGGVKASPENAERLLKKGELVCAFPEGVSGIGKLYSERYKLKNFGHGGVVTLAIKSGVPVIPCAVIGAEDIHPILWKFEEIGKKMGLPFLPVTPTFPLFGLFGLIPFPSKWKIKFGRPLLYKKSKKSSTTLTSELRDTVQRMINEESVV